MITQMKCFFLSLMCTWYGAKHWPHSLTVPLDCMVNHRGSSCSRSRVDISQILMMHYNSVRHGLFYITSRALTLFLHLGQPCYSQMLVMHFHKIYLITDGLSDNGRNIAQTMKTKLVNRWSRPPWISTWANIVSLLASRFYMHTIFFLKI